MRKETIPSTSSASESRGVNKKNSNLQAPEFHYKVGKLFPSANNAPNVVLASNLEFIEDSSLIVNNPFSSYRYKGRPLDEQGGILDPTLSVTTDSVELPGIDRFVGDWLIPQLTDKESTNSLFNAYLSAVLGRWSGKSLNNSLQNLRIIGYTGLGYDEAATNSDFFNAKGVADESDPYYRAAKNPANYDPDALWANYDGSLTLSSTFDVDAALQNIEYLINPEAFSDGYQPDLWYPSLLYTYATEEGGTSFPGPFLMINPGSTLKATLVNDIRLPGLDTELMQLLTLVRNKTYGNSGSEGLGGTSSFNFHSHGFHTKSRGFGDNVLSRFTTGQQWTTDIPLGVNHAIGNNWFHSHYHPSVNQQVYGGLSGPIQVGDPLSKVPDLKDIPRNLGVLKANAVTVDESSGELLLTGYDNLGTTINRMTMVTINGEFQPSVEFDDGGWQAFTLSNQSNQAYFRIGFINHSPSGEESYLPLYVYGEDGQQYPQILPVHDLETGEAGGALGRRGRSTLVSDFEYAQAENLILLPPGKRIELLVYVPSGETELASLNSFERDGLTYQVAGSGNYVDLSTANQGYGNSTGAGPIAKMFVGPGFDLPDQQVLDSEVDRFNQGIAVQEITPVTLGSAYSLNEIPEIQLFEQDSQGEDLWKPIRTREFNWTRNALVGPPEDYDAQTQALLQGWSEANGGAVYQPYTRVPRSGPGIEDGWLGYENPFFINDHVFPNGPLTVAQIGTIEEWVNWNWSIGSPTTYIAHPFHIHINDFQVQEADSQLSSQMNLEDVVGLNSTGYQYFLAGSGGESGRVVHQEPLAGDFKSIAPALDPDTVGDLYTFGANSQTIRMTFQDFVGAYVFHCHILPHEDAGMMMAILVIDNTDSSWLIASEGFDTFSDKFGGGVVLHQAQTLEPTALNARPASGQVWTRAQSADVTGDFVQDVVLTSGGGRSGGEVVVFDGTALQDGDALELSRFTPFADTTLAPWALPLDFTGDDVNDLVVAGFIEDQSVGIDMDVFELSAWISSAALSRQGRPILDWTKEFAVRFNLTVPPREDITAEQISVAGGDVNLDNFEDIIITYPVEDGLRISVVDGAALAMGYQQGFIEGGYLPTTPILADAILSDPALEGLESAVLTAGFNKYGQEAIENFVLTTNSDAGSQAYTLQLQVGHFVATSLPNGETIHGGHGGSHGHHDHRLMNRRDDLLPMRLDNVLQLPENTVAATPEFVAGLAHGATLVDDLLVIAQGNEANGTPSNDSGLIINDPQQLVIELPGLTDVSPDDLDGVTDSELDTVFSAEEFVERLQLTATASLAYCGWWPWPSMLAELSANVLGAGETASSLADDLLSDPLYSDAITEHWGAPYGELTPDEIIGTTFDTLYGRSPTTSEIDFWNDQLISGQTTNDYLPLSILQSTQEADQPRVAFSSAITEWLAVQWGTTANVVGSFGQGLAGDLPLAQEIDRLPALVPAFSSWLEAQHHFDELSGSILGDLVGTRAEDSGFF